MTVLSTHPEHRTPVSGIISTIEVIFVRSIEAVAAVLLACEVVLLGSGVVARYVFGSPLLWSDELAVILLLWIALLGAVSAAHRGQHMRLTILVSRVDARWQQWLEAVAIVLSIALLAALLIFSVVLVQEHWDIMTPTLRIRDGIRLVALPVGFALLALALAFRLFRTSGPLDLSSAVVVGVIIAAVVWTGRPWILAMGSWNLALFFLVGVCALILIGMPIAFAFGLTTVGFLAVNTTVPLSIVAARIDAGISDLLLLAIPLFIVLGLLMELTGMARILIGLLASLLGHIRGGLSFSLFGAMFLVSGISGSKAADIAAIAPVMVPEMRKRGYQPGELVALLSSSAAASETIPPSLVLIALGAVAGVSIASLFAVGLIPAVIAGAFLVAVAYVRARRMDAALPAKAPMKEVRAALLKALPALALPFVIRAAVVEGIATATEVATVGIVYSLAVGFLFYRDTDWRRLAQLLVTSATLSGTIFIILGMATAMAWALTQSGFTQDLMQVVTAVPGGQFGFILMSIVVFALLGSLLEGLPALVLLAPLMFPASQAMGLNDVHYSMVIILSMGLGLFAPPFGVGYYMTCAISGLPADAGLKAVWPYLGALFLAIVAVGLLQWIASW